MKRLVTYCKQCDSKIHVRKIAVDRVELQRKEGDFLELPCKNCNAKSQYHINDISATHTIIPVIVLILALILVPILIFLLQSGGYLKVDHILYNGGLVGTVIVIPMSIAICVGVIETKQMRTFNRYRVKKK